MKWPKSIDWNHIRSIDLNLSVLLPIASKLTALKKFSIEASITDTREGVQSSTRKVRQLESFLSQIGPLKEIELSNVGGRHALPAMLKIHESENITPYPSLSLTKEDLRALRRTCTELEELDVDVDRNGQWVCTKSAHDIHE